MRLIVFLPKARHLASAPAEGVHRQCSDIIDGDDAGTNDIGPPTPIATVTSWLLRSFYWVCTGRGKLPQPKLHAADPDNRHQRFHGAVAEFWRKDCPNKQVLAHGNLKPNQTKSKTCKAV